MNKTKFSIVFLVFNFTLFFSACGSSDITGLPSTDYNQPTADINAHEHNAEAIPTATLPENAKDMLITDDIQTSWGVNSCELTETEVLPNEDYMFLSRKKYSENEDIFVAPNFQNRKYL